MTRRIGFLVAVLALMAAACGSDTGLGGNAEAAVAAPAAPAVTSAPVEATPAAQPAPAPGSGDGEGIRVHGHWTIEVRNPDGSLDQRVEFENALVDDGRNVLLALLRGPDQDFNSTTISGWSIAAFGSGSVGSDDCGVVSSSILAGCTIGLADATIAGDTLRLSASNEATSAGELTTVRTVILVGTMAPADIPPGSVAASAFTEKVIGSPVPFSAGQEIEITVEISFS